MKIIKDAVKKSLRRDRALTDTVLDIIDDVRRRGDEALLEYARRFDGAEPDNIRVSQTQIDAAYTALSAETLDTLKFAADQIRYFARQQLTCLQPLDINGCVPGLRLGHRLVPVDRCGCYVPGGRYPLPSTALMSIIPAKIAGVRSIAACTPAHNGVISPAVLAAIDIAGADEIYCMGGAQAIAAMAYGTQSIRRTDLIVGPGNRFVTEAKRQVIGDVGIDALAGPSEVLILADGSADPRFLAIDLLAQAEHDPISRAILLATDDSLLHSVENELERLLADLPTAETARQAWRDNGQLLLADDLAEAIAFSDCMAPEHLELQVNNAMDVAEMLHHYGSLFIGPYSPVALGDFVSGPNHTLPTMSTARFSGGLWVGTFIKVAFWQEISAEGCRILAPTCINFAELEGLAAHADSVRLRLEK